MIDIIMRLSMNQNICLAPFYLFEKIVTHFLLHTVDFNDFFLLNFIDLRKNSKF